MFSIRLLKLIYARNIEFNTSKFNKNYSKLAIEIDRKNSITVFFIGRKYRKNMNFWPCQAKFSHRIWIGKSDVSGWGGQLFDRADPRGFIFRD